MSSHCLFDEMCFDYDSTTRMAATTFGYNLCPMCHTRSVGAVSALVFDYVDLSQMIERRQGHSDSKIARPKPESAPPIDLVVDTLRSDIAEALESCEYVVREVRREHVASLGATRQGHRVQRAARLVSRHVEQFAGLALPAWFQISDDDGGPPFCGVDALLMVRRLHDQARRLLGVTDLVITLPGYCERCRLSTLRRRNGSDTVQCAACMAVQPWSEYQKRVTLTVTHTSGGDGSQGDSGNA
jgi:hypothetical protein